MFYLDNRELGDHQKIVQKIISNNTYDVPPVEKDISEEKEGPSIPSRRICQLSFSYILELSI